MVKCFIFTIGFSPEFFTASVLGRYSVNLDDEIYLIRVKTGKEIDRKSDFAVLTIKQMLSSLNVKINEVFLDPYDSCKAIEDIVRILYEKVNLILVMKLLLILVVVLDIYYQLAS